MPIDRYSWVLDCRAPAQSPRGQHLTRSKQGSKCHPPSCASASRGTCEPSTRAKSCEAGFQMLYYSIRDQASPVIQWPPGTVPGTVPRKKALIRILGSPRTDLNVLPAVAVSPGTASKHKDNATEHVSKLTRHFCSQQSSRRTTK